MEGRRPYAHGRMRRRLSGWHIPHRQATPHRPRPNRWPSGSSTAFRVRLVLGEALRRAGVRLMPMRYRMFIQAEPGNSMLMALAGILVGMITCSGAMAEPLLAPVNPSMAESIVL